MDDRAYDRIVALIYGAATDEARWRDVLDSIASVTNGVRPYVFGHDLRLRQSLSVMANLDPHWIASYERDYAAVNPLAAAAAVGQVGQTMRKSALWPVDKMRSSVFYNEWMRPQEDLWGGAGVLLIRQSDRFFAFGGFVRQRDMDALEEDWLTLCRRLTPHLQQSAEISRILGATHLRLPGNGALGADDVPAAVLVSSDLTILWHNDKALERLMTGSGMGWDLQGRLTLNDVEMHAALTHAAQQLKLQQQPKSHNFTNGAASVVRIVALPPPEQLGLPMTLLLGRSEAVILVTLNAPLMTRDATTLLRRSYGLTTAEAEVALAVFEGLSSVEIADRRGVSPLTVRSQVKTVLAKTEAIRQSELVRKIGDLLRG